jgi:phosphoesterase RecJ-like protein
MDSLRQLIRQPSHVVIVTHKNPDGDALGSTLALASILSKLLHNVTVVLPNDYPPVFNFLTGIDKVVIGEMTPENCSSCVRTRRNSFFALTSIHWTG